MATFTAVFLNFMELYIHLTKVIRKLVYICQSRVLLAIKFYIEGTRSPNSLIQSSLSEESTVVTTIGAIFLRNWKRGLFWHFSGSLCLENGYKNLKKGIGLVDVKF